MESRQAGHMKSVKSMMKRSDGSTGAGARFGMDCTESKALVGNSIGWGERISVWKCEGDSKAEVVTSAKVRTKIVPMIRIRISVFNCVAPRRSSGIF